MRRELVPTIVAEALIDLPDPLASVLASGPSETAGAVARSLAASLAPLEAECPAPDWLRPDQVAPLRRAVAALERYGGVLLADPVGSGKTYIALAVAGALGGGGVVAFVPASLKEQWRRTAAGLGVPLTVHSHEALSRGRVPEVRARFAIVDESHRFRSPGIRRYRTLARWLVGRRVLLLSATPVVNRLADLGAQLRLCIRDDALAPRGVQSLSTMLDRNEASGALGDVVLCRARPADRPRARPSQLGWHPAGSDRQILEAIDALSLSRDRGTAALLRLVLWRALASSRPALAGALGRYERLLEHATQAATLGRTVTRAEIRTFTDGALDQLVMWEVLPSLSAPADLVLGDRPALEHLRLTLESSGLDPRIAALRELLGDRRITLVFTGSRDTLEALRVALADLRPAWVTGPGAGIGHTRMRRETVLDWFRPEGLHPGRLASASPSSRPSALLATDVAAEGLNLQLAGRIVHFDLPWTSVRMDQREGRAVRLGASAAEIDVMRLAPWPALEERLRQDARLVAKRRLATKAGLDDDGRWLFRWRAETAEPARGAPIAPGIAVVAGEPEGWLIGLALDLALPDGSRRREPASLLWVEPSGRIVEEPAFIVARLAALATAPSLTADARTRAAANQIAGAVTQARLRAAQHTSWLARQAPHEQRKLARRMSRVASEAARQRNRRMLDLADRALDWLAGGVTAGEAVVVAELAELPVGRLAVAWQPLLQAPRLRPIPVPRLTGIIRVTSFPPCTTSAPYCSISTAP